MDREKDEEKPLAIPANCPPKEYVISGFTWTEIAYTAIAGAAGFMAGAYIFLKRDNPMLAAFAVLFSVSAAAVFFCRDKYTENMPDKIRILLRCMRSPKKYKYVYFNIYENLKNGNFIWEEREKNEG